MKPWQHARSSVRRWGGKVEDYLPVHDFIDSSKAAMPDLRHRAVFHHAFGVFVAERLFGPVIKTSDGRHVPTRDIAERHVIEDMGFLPSVEDWLDAIPAAAWHGGIHRLNHAQRGSLLERLTDRGHDDGTANDGRADPPGPGGLQPDAEGSSGTVPHGGR